jgi:hypothetical protein
VVYPSFESSSELEPLLICQGRGLSGAAVISDTSLACCDLLVTLMVSCG